MSFILNSLILLSLLAIVSNGYSLNPATFLSANTDNVHQLDAFDDARCKAINVVFEGKLQSVNDRTQTIDVQFSLKLEVNTNDNKVYLSIEHWNESLSTSDDVYFIFSNAKGWTKVYPPSQKVSLPLPDQKLELALDLYSHNSKWFRFRLLDFPTFQNYFTLIGGNGQCTNSLLGFGSNQLNETLYKACACCDGHKLSDSKMNCPSDLWPQNSPTQLPSSIPTPPVLQSSTVVPRTSEITCQTIVGYFVGRFQSDYEGVTRPLPPDEYKFDAQFELRFDAHSNHRKIYASVEHNNETFSSSPINPMFYIKYGSERHHAVRTNRFSFGDGFVSIPFTSEPTRFWVDISQKQSNDNQFDLFFFHNFNNSFTLHNTIGQCANKEIIDDYDGVTPDPNVYDYCFCCNEYNPDPSLNCPKSSWSN